MIARIRGPAEGLRDVADLVLEVVTGLSLDLGKHLGGRLEAPRRHRLIARLAEGVHLLVQLLQLEMHGERGEFHAAAFLQRWGMRKHLGADDRGRCDYTGKFKYLFLQYFQEIVGKGFIWHVKFCSGVLWEYGNTFSSFTVTNGSTLLHSLVKRYRAEEGDLEKVKNLCQKTSTPGEPKRTRSGLETDVFTGGFATLLLSVRLETDVLTGGSATCSAGRSSALP